MVETNNNSLSNNNLSNVTGLLLSRLIHYEVIPFEDLQLMPWDLKLLTDSVKKSAGSYCMQQYSPPQLQKHANRRKVKFATIISLHIVRRK